MNLTSSDKKKLATLFNAFGNNSFKDGKVQPDYEGKPYENLIQALYNIPEIQEIYDGDILTYGIEIEIRERFQNLPITISENEAEIIIKKLKEV